MLRLFPYAALVLMCLNTTEMRSADEFRGSGVMSDPAKMTACYWDRYTGGPC